MMEAAATQTIVTMMPCRCKAMMTRRIHPSSLLEHAHSGCWAF